MASNNGPLILAHSLEQVLGAFGELKVRHNLIPECTKSVLPLASLCLQETGCASLDHACVVGPYIVLGIGPRVLVLALHATGAVNPCWVCPMISPVSALAGDYDISNGSLRLVVALWGRGGQQLLHLAFVNGKESFKSGPVNLVSAQRECPSQIRSLLLSCLHYEDKVGHALSYVVVSLGDGRVLVISLELSSDGHHTDTKRQWSIKVGKEPARLSWLPAAIDQPAMVYLNGDRDAVLLLDTAIPKCIAVQTRGPRRTASFLPNLSKSTPDTNAFAWICSEGHLCFGLLSMELKNRLATKSLNEYPTHVHYNPAFNCIVVAAKVSLSAILASIYIVWLCCILTFPCAHLGDMLGQQCFFEDLWCG